MAGMTVALLATLAAALGALLGLFLTGLHRSARLVGSFSGGLLVGVAVFGLLPEVVSEIGWTAATILSVTGYILLMLVDRHVYPVCPSCSHDHDHEACDTTLHGFAAPLILATAFHAFLDGWSIATSQWAGTAGLGLTLPWALALHKIPEGVALGAILRASVRTRVAAFGWCLAHGISHITRSRFRFGHGAQTRRALAALSAGNRRRLLLLPGISRRPRRMA